MKLFSGIISMGLVLCSLCMATQSGRANPEVSQPSLSDAKAYPNLHAPELTAADLAKLLDMHVVKGRLPDVEGLRIGGCGLFFRDDKGNVKPLDNASFSCFYRAGVDGSRDGEVLVALAKTGKRNEMEVTLIVRMGHGSTTVKALIKPAKDTQILCSHNFSGRAGVGVDGLTNIVQIGDNEVFTFDRGEAAGGALPAAVILRTYPEAPVQVPAEDQP